MTRGNLRCPTSAFADAFVVCLLLADMFFLRLESQRPRVELPDELFQMHSSIVNSTLHLARIVFARAYERDNGWTDRHTRALSGMFVRYAVLTAFRQVQRRKVGAPTDEFSASSASFRQTATATASRRPSRSSRPPPNPAGVTTSTPELAPHASVSLAPTPQPPLAAFADDDIIEGRLEELQSLCDALTNPRAADYDIDTSELGGGPSGLPPSELDDIVDDDVDLYTGGETGVSGASDDSLKHGRFHHLYHCRPIRMQAQGDCPPILRAPSS